MSRIIRENIKKPLADEILFGNLAKGGKVKVLLDDFGELTFEIENVEETVE